MKKGACLLQAIDSTHTPMGARLLKRWMIFPLFDIHKINHRLDLVSFFIKEQDLNHEVTSLLKQIGDVERLIGKIPLRKANPREVMQLAKSLHFMEQVMTFCENSDSNSLKRLVKPLQPLTELQERIKSVIIEDAPAQTAKGGMINEGISDELDELRKISRSGKQYLLDIQKRESEKTGDNIFKNILQ